MSGEQPYRTTGPAVYEALSAVTGGQLVEYVAGDTTDASLAGCQPAGDASIKVLGVASKDAVPEADQATDSQGTTGYAGSFPVLDVSVPSPTLAVYHDAQAVSVVYTAAAVNFRDPVCAAANGQVRKWVTGVDAEEARIGWCAQPGGISAAGGAGLARIIV